MFLSFFLDVLLCFWTFVHAQLLSGVQHFVIPCLYPTRLFCPQNFPGETIGADCHFFFQGIFPTQRLNPCLLCFLHGQADSLPLSHLRNQFKSWVSESHSVMSDSLWPYGLYSPWILQTRIWKCVIVPFFRGSSQPRNWTQVLQANSLPVEPPRKPKNTEVGSLSLLQQIFPTQELNWDLLHCRQILYQLSYQGNLV